MYTVMKRKKYQKAYSLLEMSIVLVIITLIMGSLLSIALKKSENDKIIETEVKLDKIEKALSYYLAEYGSIPCPADATLGIASANFGVATRNAITPYTCDGTTGNWYSNATVPSMELGSVPTKTLQISDDYAFDAWGNRITYVMIENCNTSNIQSLPGYWDTWGQPANANYNATSNFSSSACGSSGSSALTVKNSLGADTTTNAIYILFSHGSNGHGAYPHNGGSSRLEVAASALSNDELLNAQMQLGGSFQTNNGVFVQKNQIDVAGSTYFDDIVRYKTKSQMVYESGALNSTSTINNICSMVTVKIPSSTAASSVCGSTPGNPNCSTYLWYFAEQIINLCF